MNRPRFEDAPYAHPPDETDVNLRAYFDAVPDEKQAEYSEGWSDEQVVAWDGNFRSDGMLMMVCCDRDVDVREYREVLAAYIEFRGLSTVLLQDADAAAKPE